MDDLGFGGGAAMRCMTLSLIAEFDLSQSSERSFYSGDLCGESRIFEHRSNYI
jgi:hypothetical protein